MAEQVINAPASWYLSNRSGGVNIVNYRPSTNQRPAIIAALKRNSGDVRVLANLDFRANGQFGLVITNTQTGFPAGQDLSDLFETSGSIEITVQGRSLLVALAGADMTEPYNWTPANSAEVTAFEAYVRGLSADQRGATITLRDFVPVPPGSTEQTIPLPASSYSEKTTTHQGNRLNSIRWMLDTEAIVDGLKPSSSDVRIFGTFRINDSEAGTFYDSFVGAVYLGIKIDTRTGSGTGGQGHDLSDAFEQHGTVTITIGEHSLTVSLVAADLIEPYQWRPENYQEAIEFATAVRALPSANRGGTLTLRDFTPSPNQKPLQSAKSLGGLESRAALSPPQLKSTKSLGGLVSNASIPGPVPWHSFTITSGGSGSPGYNALAPYGSIQAGSTATYDTPGEKSVTVIHARRVGTEVNFALSGAAAEAADFPERIVVTKLTNGEVVREFTVQDGSLRPIDGGVRQNYDPVSGNASDVLVTVQTIRFDLFYARVPTLQSVKSLGGLVSNANLPAFTLLSRRALAGLVSDASLPPPTLASHKSLGPLISSAEFEDQTLRSRRSLGGLVADANLSAPQLASTKSLGGLVSDADIARTTLRSTKSLGGLQSLANLTPGSAPAPPPAAVVQEETGTQRRLALTGGAAGAGTKPGLPRPQLPPELVELGFTLESLTEIVEVLSGAGRGYTLDKAVTWRDLMGSDPFILGGKPFRFRAGDSVVVSVDEEDTNISPFADEPVPNPSYIPAVRTGLSATGLFATVLLEWDTPPNFVDSVNLAYVEVYRSSTDVRPLPPSGRIAQVRGTVYADTPPALGTWYYWIRAVSKHNVPGAFNAQAGTEATTKQQTLEAALGTLNAQQLADLETALRNDLTSALDNLNIMLSQISDLADLRITTTMITNEAITTPKLRANVVEARNINVVGLLARIINTDMITANMINAAGLLARIVQAGEVIADFIGANQITANMILADDVLVKILTAGVIRADHLDAASFVTAEGRAGTFFTDLLNVSTIAGQLLEDGTIDVVKLAAILRSDNFVSGVSGWSINRAGQVELNEGFFRGDVSSIDFLTGVRGWILRRDGTGELDAAYIRGVLAAAHIDSDVLNVVSLWEGDHTFNLPLYVGQSRRRTQAFPLRAGTDIDDYAAVLLLATPHLAAARGGNIRNFVDDAVTVGAVLLRGNRSSISLMRNSAGTILYLKGIATLGGLQSSEALSMTVVQILGVKAGSGTPPALPSPTGDVVTDSKYSATVTVEEGSGSGQERMAGYSGRADFLASLGFWRVPFGSLDIINDSNDVDIQRLTMFKRSTATNRTFLFMPTTYPNSDDTFETMIISVGNTVTRLPRSSATFTANVMTSNKTGDPTFNRWAWTDNPIPASGTFVVEFE